MKHLYIIFLALLACCPEVIHAENEISYLAEIWDTEPGSCQERQRSTTDHAG